MENIATIYGKTTETASITVSITIYSYAFVYWCTGVSKLIYNGRGTVISVLLDLCGWSCRYLLKHQNIPYPLATEGFKVTWCLYRAPAAGGSLP